MPAHATTAASKPRTFSDDPFARNGFLVRKAFFSLLKKKQIFNYNTIKSQEYAGYKQQVCMKRIDNYPFFLFSDNV